MASTHETVVAEQGMQPVLRTEEVALTSDGRVKKLEGKISRLKRVDQKSGYQNLAVGDVVKDGDILVLEKKSSLVLDVPHAPETSLWTVDKDRWFTILVRDAVHQSP